MAYPYQQLLVQKFLRDGGTLANLQASYAIKAKRHGEYPNLVLLKYDQIESPFSEPIVCECRGVILDEDDNWRVVSRAFDKFFNYGEGHAAKIDWSTARVQEKVDGSLCVVYEYRRKWHVASSGTPDASGQVNGADITFSNLFWRSLRKTYPDHSFDMPASPNDECYIFELTTPYNKVVVPHADEKVTLLAIRNRATGCFLDMDEYRKVDPPDLSVVREFPLQTLEQIEESFKHFSGATQEGYVVVDGNQNRIKIKHPSYVALHHMRDGFGTRRMISLLQQNEQAEVLVHFPEFKPLFDKIKAKYDLLANALEILWEATKNEPTQKDFALKVKDAPFSGILFQLRAKKIGSVREGLSLYRTDAIRDLLEVREELPTMAE